MARDLLEQTLATLPEPSLTHSFTLLERDSAWWYDRIRKPINEHWIIESITPYETEGYKFVRVKLIRNFPKPPAAVPTNWRKVVDFFAKRSGWLKRD